MADWLSGGAALLVVGLGQLVLAVVVAPAEQCCSVAPNGALGRMDDVIAETDSATTRNITSRTTVSADEAVEAGQRLVGPGYMEIGEPGSGVFLSSDELQRFRIDNGSLTGSHQPRDPHVDLELFANQRDKVAPVNNHIPFLD